MSDFLQSRTPNQFSRRMPRRRSSGGLQDENRLPLRKQLVRQLLCLFIAFVIIFPMLWIVSLSLDPRYLPADGVPADPARQASFDAYKRVFDQPTANPVKFRELARNSLLLATSVALFAIAVGILAAYSFSRFEFKGRKAIMFSVVTVLMLPTIATIAPLFVMLNRVQINIGDIQFNLRNSLLGVAIALTAGQLPFAIWNLKGYLDTIPARAGRGRPHRRRKPEPVVHPNRVTAGVACPGRDRLPRLQRRLDGVCAVVDVPDQPEGLHPGDVPV